MNRKHLEELFILSERIGRKIPFWTQGPGGNVSVKHGNEMWIKSSGTRLDQIRQPGSIACVAMSGKSNLEKLLEKVPGIEDENSYSDWIREFGKPGDSLGRPSMETGFHLVLKKKYVFHFHSLAAILFMDSLKKNPALTDSFKELGYLIKTLNARRPGLALTQELYQSKEAQFYLLENHGVILESDSPDIISRWESFENDYLSEHYPDLLRSYNSDPEIVLQRPFQGPIKYYFPDIAVFRDDLLKELIPTSGEEFYLADTAAKDLKEIWAASVILYEACPSLSELPQSILQTINSLPTEKFRMKKEKKP